MNQVLLNSSLTKKFRGYRKIKIMLKNYPIKNILYQNSKDASKPILATEAVNESVKNIETVFKRYSPSAPFDYKFTDEAYAAKFSGEERIGKLATLFATLAIFISCLGLFGLASYVAEQRTTEIGVRKVFGPLNNRPVGITIQRLCDAGDHLLSDCCSHILVHPESMVAEL